MGYDSCGGSVGAVEEIVDRRAGKTGGLFGLSGRRYSADDEEPRLELTDGVPSFRRQVAESDGSDSKLESSSFICVSSRREPSLSIGVEIIDKQSTESYGGG